MELVFYIYLEIDTIEGSGTFPAEVAPVCLE